MNDTELPAYSGEHVLYEFAMLQQATNALVEKAGATGFPTSVLIESFGIHLRNLICFLFDKGQQDDVLAHHFFDDPSAWNTKISSTLQDARIRANKEISHLTQQRKSDQHPDKPWQVVKLWDEIYQIGKEFASKASASKLHSKVTEFFKRDAKDLKVWVASNLQYSNSTATVIQTSAFTTQSIRPTISVVLKK